MKRISLKKTLNCLFNIYIKIFFYPTYNTYNMNINLYYIFYILIFLSIIIYFFYIPILTPPKKNLKYHK